MNQTTEGTSIQFLTSFNLALEGNLKFNIFFFKKCHLYCTAAIWKVTFAYNHLSSPANSCSVPSGRTEAAGPLYLPQTCCHSELRRGHAWGRTPERCKGRVQDLWLRGTREMETPRVGSFLNQQNLFANLDLLNAFKPKTRLTLSSLARAPFLHQRTPAHSAGSWRSWNVQSSTMCLPCS